MDRERRVSPWLLVLLISLPSVSAVLFTPSLPLLASHFGLSASAAQASMTIFLIGYALGLFPYGLIARRWGTRRAICLGLFVSLVGALLCACSFHFWFFCAGRFIQALGAAVGLTLPLALLANRSRGAHSLQALSYMVLAFAAMPGLATAIGGLCTAGLGWRGCFGVLILYTLGLYGLCRKMPDTSNAPNPPPALRELGKQFFPALLMGCTAALIYVFASAAPYLAIGQMGMDPRVYGLWNLLPALGTGIGLFFSTQLIHFVTARAAILSGILLSLVGVIALNISLAGGFFSGVSLFLPMLFIQWGSGISYGVTSGAVASAMGGHAPVLFSVVNLSIAVVAMFALEFVLPMSSVALGGLFAAIVGCQFVAWFAQSPER